MSTNSPWIIPGNMSTTTAYTVAAIRSTLDKDSHQYATQDMKELDTVDIILLICFTLVFIIGVFGNIIVCYVFNKHTIRLSIMELLIVILAIVDLFASFFNPLVFIYWTVTSYRKWHFGDFGCKLLPGLTRISVSVSFGIILIITIDRCIVICFPFKRTLKRRDVYLLVFATFVLSIITELHYTISMIVDPKTTCLVPHANEPKFVYPFIVFTVLRSVLFVSIFTTTVFLIYRTLYDKEHVATMKQQKHVQKTKKIMKMLVALAAIFILLVFPREITQLVYNASWLSPRGLTYSEAFIKINSFFKVLHMSNSICNVFIYSQLHSKFRRRGKKLINYFFKGEVYNKSVIEDAFTDRRKTITTFYDGYDKSKTINSLKGNEQSPVQFSITRLNREKWIKRYSKLILDNRDVIDFNRETIL